MRKQVLLSRGVTVMNCERREPRPPRPHRKESSAPAPVIELKITSVAAPIDYAELLQLASDISEASATRAAAASTGKMAAKLRRRAKELELRAAQSARSIVQRVKADLKASDGLEGLSRG